MDKIFIQNRKGQKVAVLLEEQENQRGLAFVMHGLSGRKEQPHVETFARAFFDSGYTVVRFDTTNTFGESEGAYENATITNYYEDLEDVIAWSTDKPWYQEPFALAGHSLGGICTALYAETYPEKVSLLAPISPVVSGALSVKAHETHDPEGFTAWKTNGWREEESVSQPGLLKRLPWSHIEDRLRYDLLPNAHKLSMPVLLIVGENDTSTPPDHVALLHEAVPGPKEFHVLEDAPHTFRDPRDLENIDQIMKSWIDTHTI